MNKLKLHLDDLRIDSFDNHHAAEGEGDGVRRAVHVLYYTQCTCPGCPTCDVSCNGTCGATCAASCYGSCDWTCEDTCDYSCGGFTCETSPSPVEPCMACRDWSSNC